MCPACIATAALVVAGATSTGGVTALLMSLRMKNGPTKPAQNPNETSPNQRRTFDGDE
jgi:hypothetical protein